ncbi:Alpha/Beta hydrolase protein [Durotheca rogersii]|uniref:Alpha/Beta hydrolase protein n=1 Tax=Durotheca rogersii TaxID=419775 RepID=UPI00222090F7|nr:Alpha/Beta hydrolase protein [Durotheca rogersii]KAI5860588.1 Alpha/Beta hydrolase protein [Durotheca rogersii]
MEKSLPLSAQAAPPAPQPRSSWPKTLAVMGLVVLAAFYHHPHLPSIEYDGIREQYYDALTGGVMRYRAEFPYGRFPLPDDPFRFVPCTNATLPPPLDDAHPERSWARLFDPDPEHWSWGKTTTTRDARAGHDPYAERGIYLCGYLDVPLDYTNQSDLRIVRLAVTKYQVSGLARVHPVVGTRSRLPAGSKSERTIVIEPGGPGGSGTSYAWRAAEDITKRLSDGKFDVLGWDPRGVNTTSPSVACYPHDADRDRWSMLTGQYREVSGSLDGQLELADAMNDAIFRACWERHGDLGRFVGTAFVARDMEEIRKALGEDELTGYLVSYGTGIGQTWANMFPHSVGRVILDGTEYVRDHRLLGGFGWTALDNATDAWHDGFLGECLKAGPEHCALSQPRGPNPVTLEGLEDRMHTLVSSLIQRPIVGYVESSGPAIVTYSALVAAIYGALYNAQSWPALAQMLFELEGGNSTLASAFLDRTTWEYDPALPSLPFRRPSTDELGYLVICADSYDAPLPSDGLVWWQSLWANMTGQAWISGNSRFFNVFPCRHFQTYWPRPAEVYRGDLNHTLRNPVLLIAETYDPATPLRNGRRLAAEMGRNARLIVHHGYGHSSRDKSACTDAAARAFILEGTLPEDPETACYADEKPYLYGVTATETGAGSAAQDPVEAWREHVRELALWNLRLLPN